MERGYPPPETSCMLHFQLTLRQPQASLVVWDVLKTASLRGGKYLGGIVCLIR